MKSRVFAIGIAFALAFAACENPVSSSGSDKVPTTPAAPDAPPAPATPDAPPAPKPAFGGWYFDDRRIACYWQDGVRHGLGESLAGSSRAIASTASSGDVLYVAGTYETGTGEEAVDQPCYWANGTLVSLKGPDGMTDLSEGGAVTGIATANGTVYVSGSTGSEQSATAGYWAGTSFHAVTLPEGVTVAYAMSVAVSASGDVYVGGYYYKDDAPVPCVWKNGTPADLSLLPGATAAYPDAIALAGADVYLVGTSYIPAGEGTYEYEQRPCCWKNGECFALDGPEADKSFPGEIQYARSLCVVNGSVYAAGYYVSGDFTVPCYWEGTTLHILSGVPDADMYASSIAVSGGVVSVAGYYRKESPKARVSSKRSMTPCYWEGGIFHDLIEDTPEGSIPFPEVGAT